MRIRFGGNAFVTLLLFVSRCTAAAVPIALTPTGFVHRKCIHARKHKYPNTPPGHPFVRMAVLEFRNMYSSVQGIGCHECRRWLLETLDFRLWRRHILGWRR
ncbi:hypothetical protein C8Q72DRAFT_598816 [Fomitopsis betulina]|nr:hypothetical protein C8Q72DRAFT_598816 [Fomitopsis betulina]